MRAYLVSPYAGPVMENVEYAKRCMRDSLSRGEAPFASHLLYTQDGILNDAVWEDRLRGIYAGQQWADAADVVAVYTDYGISDGMRMDVVFANRTGKPIEYRSIL